MTTQTEIIFKHDKDAFNAGFKALRKAGYFARQNYWCCQSCAWADVPEEKSEKVVFYHQQDNDSFEGTKTLHDVLHFAWEGNAEEIVRIFNEATQNRFFVYHSGDDNKRIAVMPFDKKDEYLWKEEIDQLRQKGLILKEGLNEVTDRKDIIAHLLNTPKDIGQVVLHYRCSICGDEQVTDAESVQDVYDLIRDSEEFRLPCTNCDSRETIKYDDVFAIEVI